MGTEMQGSSDAAPEETAKEPQGDCGLTPCQGLSQKNDCPTPDNGANKDTVGNILARRITGLQSTLEEHWVAAERADSEYRAEIAKLQAEIAFHRKVLATLNAVHAIKETMPSPCPYVVGNTTKYCSLTPFTLTGEEREAITDAADRYASVTPESAETAATLRGLLSRTGPNTTKTDESAAECSDQAEKNPERERLSPPAT